MMIQQVLRSVSVVRFFWVWCAVLFAVAPAAAEPIAAAPPVLNTIAGVPGRRVAVDTPLSDYSTPNAVVSQTIYLARCQPSCVVTMGPNDARINKSTIPAQETSTILEFENTNGQSGAAADAEWAEVVQCMKEVYSPFNVQITDVRPTSGNFHMAIIAGSPGEIGLDDNILGVAPLAGNCSPIDNVISFSFANIHPPSTATSNRVYNLCWTAAQESAHAFGLDHEFSYLDNRSACNDPMTYRNDCGGQKFFRNEKALCGETSARACKCTGNQNSHEKLEATFGPGTPITGNPSVMITSPTSGGTTAQVVGAMAGSKRGVARVELFFNGFKWAETLGAAFGRQGQPNPSDYAILIPAALPSSVVDIKAVAYDDLGLSTESVVVTATRGGPCQSASNCATGQKCEAGKCFWDPPAGEIGDECTYPQFCKSLMCRGTSDQQICTHNCLPFMTDSCEPGLECVLDTPELGVCFLPDSGGCCSVGRGGRDWVPPALLAAVVLAFVMRRRRR